MIRKAILAACVFTLVVIPAADAATATNGAVYGAKAPVDTPRETRDNSLRIRVASNGKTLDLIGPHEACAGNVRARVGLAASTPSSGCTRRSMT